MTINYENLYKSFETFGEIIELAGDILSRLEPEDLDIDEFDDALFQAMDSGLIYTKDQWTMIEYYCTPQEANFEEAWEAFYGDLRKAVINGALRED